MISPDFTTRMPLSTFLLELSAVGIRITLHDIRRVQRVLDTQSKWTHSRLRRSLLSLLAKSESQRVLIENVYEQRFQLGFESGVSLQSIDAEQLKQDLQTLLWQVEQQEKSEVNESPDPESTNNQKKWWLTALPILMILIVNAVLFRSEIRSFFSEDVSNETNKIAVVDVLIPSDQRSDKTLITTIDKPSELGADKPSQLPIPQENTVAPVVPDQTETPKTELPPKDSLLQETAATDVSQLSLTTNFTPVKTTSVIADLIQNNVKPIKAEPSVLERTLESLWFWWLGALASALLCTYLWIRLIKSRQMPKLPTALLWDKSGDVYFDPAEIGGKMPRWLNDEILDYCADSIGYEYSEESGGLLDVAATIQASAKSAGYAEIRMLPKRETHEVLILFDVQAPDQRWCPLAQELAVGLRQRGLTVTLGAMHGSLQTFRRDDGGWANLADVVASDTYFVTLIFADAHLPDWREDALLLESLAHWPSLVWVTVREPRYWNGREERLQAAGFDLWAAEPANFMNMFRQLVDDVTYASSQRSGYRRFMRREASEPLTRYAHRLLGDTLPLARIVSVLPPPVSPVLLVRILQTLAPKLPLTRLQRLYALPDTDVNSPDLSLGYDVLKLLRAEFHDYTRDTQKQIVKTAILGWFEAARPSQQSSLRYYQWRWRYLRVLMEFSPDEAIPQLEQLQSLAPFKSRIDREFGQESLPIPLPDVEDEANRKRLWRLSKGKVISEAVVWPASASRKRTVAWAGVLSLVFVCGGVWKMLPPKNTPDIAVIEQNASLVQANPSVVQSFLNTLVTPSLAPQQAVLLAEKTPIPEQAVVEPVATIVTAPLMLPEMVTIPAGVFTMGCVEGRDDMISIGYSDDEKPDHEVTIKNDFELGKYEVTNEQYVAFLNAVKKRGSDSQPWFETQGEDKTSRILAVKDNTTYSVQSGYEQHPVVNVSWYGAQAYLSWLTEQTKGDVSKGEWRLPTEAEWEYAARGGSNKSNAYSWGNQVPVCDTQAVNGAQFGSCDKREPIKVGSFVNNLHPFDLFDIHGNVWEWVEDCWESNYKKTPIDGTAVIGCDATASRVLRGGAWNYGSGLLRSANRGNFPADNRDGDVGFRAARTLFPLPSTSGETQLPLAEASKQAREVSGLISEQPAVMLDGKIAPTPNMIRIIGKEFLMGCEAGRDDVEGDCDDDEKPAHKVNVPTFWMSETEVTVGQYLACVEAGACPEPEWREAGSQYNIKTGSDDYYKKMGEAITGLDYPIVGVSWDNAQRYVKWLSEATGNNYRLPSESEWEFAARGGAEKHSAYSWGNQIPVCDSQAFNGAQFTSCEKNEPIKVGSFVNNQHPFGLLDMHGNVWEWVEDCWESDYKKTPIDGTAAKGCGANASRVLRGGSWNDTPWGLRSASRFDFPADSRYNGVGFRAARTD